MEDLPTVRQITSAIPMLRQAYELAIQIEALDSCVGDELISRERRQFQSQFEQMAAKLSFDLVERGPPRVVINNDDQVTGMSQ